jgi:hypothetical protein
MMKDKDWWVCWRPWSVEELKSESAFNGGLFTIFWMRTRAWCVCDIFPDVLNVVAYGVCSCTGLLYLVGEAVTHHKRKNKKAKQKQGKRYIVRHKRVCMEYKCGVAG